MGDQAKRDLAASYQLMMESGAWKHFNENFLNRIEEQATKDEDAVPMEDLSMARIAECRGRRKAIELIRNGIDFILFGNK